MREYVGGYEDWLRQRQLEAASGPGAQEALSAPSAQAAATPAVPGKRRGSTAREGGRLSYNEQRELERLPALIETLEGEEQRLNAEMAHPEFYKERPEAIARVIARLEQLQVELPTAYARWDELDSRAPSGQSGGAARPA